MDSEIKKITLAAKELNIKLDEKSAQAIAQTLKNLEAQQKAADQAEKLRIKEIEAARKQALREQIAEQKRAAKEAEAMANLPTLKRNLQNDFQAYVLKNSKAIKDFGVSLEKLKIQIDEISNPAEYQAASQGFVSLKKEIAAAGQTGRSLFGELFNDIKKFTYWVAAGTVLMGFIRAVKQAMDEVVKLNAAMVNLQMATGYNIHQAQQLMVTYNQMAKELGATTIQIADAANQWLRQGKTVEETNELIKDSMMLSKITSIESADATKYLTSASKGYGVAVKDVIGIVDQLTAVDLKSATSAADLAEGMSRTANMAKLSGIEMSKLIGYLATVQEVTQKDAASVGESFKTMFSRMGNVKAGRYFDEEGEDISDVESTLAKFDIRLRDSANNFRNFGDVLDEIASKWDKLSNVDKNAISVALAGIRQRENLLVLLNNYNKALEYMKVAQDSAGTASEKFANYQNSVAAAQDRVTASFEKLSSTALSSNTYKDVLNTISSLIDGITGIINLLGTIPTIITTIIGALSLLNKNAGRVNMPSYARLQFRIA